MTPEIIKVAVIGLYGAGKTTLIQTISQRTAFRGEGQRAWYYGQVDVDETLTLQFVEPPSGARFNYMWLRDLVSALDVHGYIVMVDSTRPETFAEFTSVLYTIRAQYLDLPVVIAANKQNHHRAWSVRDIRLILSLGNDVPMMACVANDFEAVKNVVVRILYEIYD